MKNSQKIKKNSESAFNKNTFIIIATLVFVGGLFFGNLANPETGYGIYGRLSYLENDPLTANRGLNPVTTIEVIPDKIIAGETIRIKIDPGINGARQEVKFYKVNDLGNGVLVSDTNVAGFYGRTTQQNTGFKIFNNVTFPFKTSTDWRKGVYEARIYDLNTREYIPGVFEIVAYKSKVEDVRKSGFYEQLEALDR